MKGSAPSIRAAELPTTLAAAEFIDIRGLSERSLDRVRVSQESMYGDTVWNFHKEIGAHVGRDSRVNFDNIVMLDGSSLTAEENQIYLAAFKPFVYTLISNPLKSQRRATS